MGSTSDSNDVFASAETINVLHTHENKINNLEFLERTGRSVTTGTRLLSQGVENSNWGELVKSLVYFI